MSCCAQLDAMSFTLMLFSCGIAAIFLKCHVLLACPQHTVAVWLLCSWLSAKLRCHYNTIVLGLGDSLALSYALPHGWSMAVTLRSSLG